MANRPTSTQPASDSYLSVWVKFLAWSAALLFTFHACTHMHGATDTWKAMAAGRYYLNHGVSTLDPFSETSRKPGPAPEQIRTLPAPARWLAERLPLSVVAYWHPTGWINQNWLSGVFLYWLAYLSPITDSQDLSFNSLVYLKFALYLATALCLFCASRILGATTAVSAVFTCVAMFVSRSFLHIRPADFTNVAASVFILVLALTIRRNRLYIWLIVPLLILWCNLHGGFMFGFVALAAFVACNALSLIMPRYLSGIGLKGIMHALGAAFVALAGVIVFNPFHLANITHSFVVTIGKDAKLWQTSEEWAGSLQSSTFGNTRPFLAMLAAAGVIFAIWAIAAMHAHRWAAAAAKKEIAALRYEPPRINLGLLAVAASAAFMALGSRRFIPLAAITVSPLLASLVSQVISSPALMRKFAGPAARRIKLAAGVAVTVVLLLVACRWGLKFKTVYLDSWPPGGKLSSVFMRMTGSGSDPFGAAAFINDNHLTGTCFCYWTQGDFLALFERPDPNTGRIPLQVFMDSRAQTAYDLDVQDAWVRIINGGPTVQRAGLAKADLTADDLAKVARWADEQLKNLGIPVVLMPSTWWQKPFVNALQIAGDWRLVYLDDKQKLFVDIATPQGKSIFDGIFSDATVYPNRPCKDLIAAYYLITRQATPEQRRNALDSAIGSSEPAPSVELFKIILRGAAFTELKPVVDDFCRKYLADFTQNKIRYADGDGYYPRISCAILAAIHLHSDAVKRNDVADAAELLPKLRQYQNEIKLLQPPKTW